MFNSFKRINKSTITTNATKILFLRNLNVSQLRYFSIETTNNNHNENELKQSLSLNISDHKNLQQQHQHQEKHEEEPKQQSEEKEEIPFLLRLALKLLFIYTGATFWRGSDFNYDIKIDDIVKTLDGDLIHVFNELPEEYYHSFSNYKVYQLQDIESFYFIFKCINGDNELAKIRLIESGIYKYCIDYLLNYHHQNQQQQQSQTNLYLKYYTLSKFKREVDQESDAFEKEARLLYTQVIKDTIQYNKNNGLPDIQLPKQLVLGTTSGSSCATILNFDQYVEKEFKKDMKVAVQGMSVTLAYMLIRTNKKLFPNFGGNRVSNIIVSSLTTGLFLMTGFEKKSTYEPYIKNMFINVIGDQQQQPSSSSSSIITKCNQSLLKHPWFFFTYGIKIPFLLLQHRLYFFLPYLTSLSLLNKRLNIDVQVDMKK